MGVTDTDSACDFICAWREHSHFDIKNLHLKNKLIQYILFNILGFRIDAENVQLYCWFYHPALNLLRKTWTAWIYCF